MTSRNPNAVDQLRTIRDRQARALARKSKADRIAFFRKAGEAAIEEARAGQRVRRRRAS
ncbi:MAG: hypothetical protein U0572_11390 [Phycisphaerales bacterium]